MKTPFTLGALGIVLVVAAGTPRSSAASNSQVAAGVAVGSVVIPPAVQALSGSSIQVTVEVYRETIPLENILNGTEGGQDLPPFPLQQPVALQRRLREGQAYPNLTTLAEVANHAERLLPIKIKLEHALPRLIETRNELKKYLDAHGLTARGAALIEEANTRAAAQQSLITAITKFREAATGLIRLGQASPAQLAAATRLLVAVRLAAAEFPGDVSSNWAGFFRSQILTQIFLPLTARNETPPERAPGSAATPPKIADLSAPVGTPASADKMQSRGLQQSVRQAVERIESIEKAGNVFIRTDGKPSTADVAAMKKTLVNLCVAMGAPLTEAELFQTNSDIVFVHLWASNYFNADLPEAKEQAVAETFPGLTNGANLGPIVNEVLQTVLGENRTIDQIVTHSHRWAPFASAYSRTSAGDHTAVIYFENMLVPILKSARFDPSQLLAANAQVFRRATNVMGQVFGVPTTQEALTGADAGSLNVLSYKARKENAEEAVVRKRQAMLDALQEVLDARDALEALKDDADKTKWKDNAKARTQLTELAAALAATGLQLEAP